MLVLEAATAALRRGERVVMVTVIGDAGSTPRKAGARMLVRADGTIAGTIGGGRLEHLVIADAVRLLREEPPGAQPRTVEVRLSADLAMCCGGVMKLFVEPLDPPPALVLFGAGHVAQAVASAAAPLGYRTFIVDDNEDLLNRVRFPEAIAAELVPSFEPEDFLAALPVAGAYAVITTREHRLDQELLRAVIDLPWAYLGLIGSRTKVEKFRQRLGARGVPAESLARVRMPVGLDIGAQTPEEIAVSILAEVIAVRRAQAGATAPTAQPLRQAAVKPALRAARAAAARGLPAPLEPSEARGPQGPGEPQGPREPRGPGEPREPREPSEPSEMDE